MNVCGSAPTPLKIDLVMATVNRTSEVVRLFDALAHQSHRRFRAIVVDQNTDGRLDPIIHEYMVRIPIVRIASALGLSRARNLGLQAARGDVVAFPDDDCWYPEDLLSRVSRMLLEHPEWDGITGRFTDSSGQSVSARWDAVGGGIDRFNVWRRGISGTIFLRRHVVERIGAFDEELGLGSGTDFGSGEETDYLLRGLRAGFSFHYDPALTIFHPDSRRVFDRATVQAGWFYGAGMGRVLRKHHPFWFAAYHCARALGGAVLTLCAGRHREARFHWAVARGRLHGWRAPLGSPAARKDVKGK